MLIVKARSTRGIRRWPANSKLPPSQMRIVPNRAQGWKSIRVSRQVTRAVRGIQPLCNRCQYTCSVFAADNSKFICFCFLKIKTKKED